MSATVHQLATETRRPGRLLRPGVLDMPESAAKLDKLLDEVHKVTVSNAEISAKLDRALADGADHEARLRVLEQRPAGLTGRALLAGAGATVALAVAVVELLSRISLR